MDSVPDVLVTPRRLGRQRLFGKDSIRRPVTARCGGGAAAPEHRLSWTTGTIAFQTAAIHLLGAGFTTTPYSPVFLTVSFPLGAVLFLLMRGRLRAAA